MPFANVCVEREKLGSNTFENVILMGNRVATIAIATMVATIAASPAVITAKDLMGDRMPDPGVINAAAHRPPAPAVLAANLLTPDPAINAAVPRTHDPVAIEVAHPKASHTHDPVVNAAVLRTLDPAVIEEALPRASHTPDPAINAARDHMAKVVQSAGSFKLTFKLRKPASHGGLSCSSI